VLEPVTDLPAHQLGDDRPHAAQITAELDRFIVGQGKAKRAVAIALRKPVAAAEPARRAAGRGGAQEHHHDRAHRGRKTEIARRLAKLAQPPFSKWRRQYTEVGYVGSGRGVHDP